MREAHDPNTPAQTAGVAATRLTINGAACTSHLLYLWPPTVPASHLPNADVQYKPPHLAALVLALLHNFPHVMPLGRTIDTRACMCSMKVNSVHLVAAGSGQGPVWDTWLAA